MYSEHLVNSTLLKNKLAVLCAIVELISAFQVRQKKTRLWGEAFILKAKKESATHTIDIVEWEFQDSF